MYRFLVVCLVFASLSCQSASVKLSFREPVITIVGQNSLGSLVLVKTTDAELTKKITSFPFQVDGEVIRHDEIVRYVQGHIGKEHEVKWRGEKAAKVVRRRKAERVLIEKAVAEKLSVWVQRTYGKDSYVFAKDETESIALDENERFLEFELDESRSTHRWASGYFVTAHKQGKKVRHQRSFRIFLKRPSLVSICELERDSALKRDCFVVQDNEVTQDKFVNLSTDLSSLRLKGPINTGDVLTEKVVTYVKLVNKGDRVLAVYSNNSISIQSKAIASSSGDVGESINILLPSAKIEVTAVVESKNRVVISGG
ncbi:flagella basal body P-ring formation protein FlgA [Vibrio vulnificus]|nr:flagella basal body P-ring formation protein FlgA [Vibrio vulnificus]